MRTREPRVERDEPWPPGRMATLEPYTEFLKKWRNLSAMNEVDRRKAWEFIKIHKPSTAALLSDPIVQRLRSTFGADIFIEVDDLRDSNA